jgi:hypothetical protein
VIAGAGPFTVIVPMWVLANESWYFTLPALLAFHASTSLLGSRVSSPALEAPCTENAGFTVSVQRPFFALMRESEPGRHA